jgi:hypothetical protein
MRIVQRLVLPLILLFFSGAPALAQGAVWTVSELKGEVTVIDAGGQRPAKVGTQLAPGATVRTAARASAVLVRGKEFVTLRQNAQLRIAPAERKRGIVQILQDYGSALFSIGKQSNPHFGVETPYLAAVVKGTTFVITVSNEGASLQVTEGAVETSTLDGGAVELIRPGAVAIIAAADPLRMVIEGEGRKVIDSPARVAPSTAPAAPSGAAQTAAPVPEQVSAEPAASDKSSSPRIEEPIVSTPQDLGAISNGFASGDVAVLAAIVAADNARDNGKSGGRPDDGEACVAGTCTNGNANGSDGGNGNGTDNGNGSGNGNGNGTDNGNGSGNGNGNGTDNGSGNGGGNGNGGGGRGPLAPNIDQGPDTRPGRP